VTRARERWIHGARVFVTYRATSSLLGSSTYQSIQRRRVRRQILHPAPSTDAWILQVDTSYFPAVNGSDSCLLDVWRRCGDEHDLPALYVDGMPVNPAISFARLLGGSSSSRVAVGGFRIFDNVEETMLATKGFDDFRLRREFAFLDGSRVPRDEHLLATYWLARWHDPILWKTLLNDLRESELGWGSGYPPPRSTLTTTTWAHTYYVSLLSRFFGPEAGLRVVEIGGGYGGFARVRSILRPRLFRHHTIVDLPEMNRLQAWFLRESGLQAETETDSPLPAPIALVPAGKASKVAPADLVVATQSLTELNVDEIVTYLETTLLPSKAVLLAMQRRFYGLPHVLDWLPRRLVSEGFNIVNLDVLEGPNVICILLVRNTE
jgi:hypothetical protein